MRARRYTLRQDECGMWVLKQGAYVLARCLDSHDCGTRLWRYMWRQHDMLPVVRLMREAK